MKRKVLVVDDDRTLAGLVTFHLGEFGFETLTAFDSDSGLRRALCENVDLVILDLKMPGMGGFEVCKRIRAAKPGLQILILSSNAGESDKVLGLELGADDYLTKPFSMRELVARVQARLRTGQSAGKPEPQGAFSAGNLSIDFERRTVTLSGQPVKLTATEYDLLAFLATNCGKPFSREQLLSSVWGYSYSGYEHTVNTHVNRLREKIEENPASPSYILTVRGLGYRCAEPSEFAKQVA